MGSWIEDRVGSDPLGGAVNYTKGRVGEDTFNTIAYSNPLTAQAVAGYDLSHPPVDNTAEYLRQQEEARQARIRKAKADIENVFSRYGKDYYNKLGQDYLGYYTPQLDDQYENARRSLIVSLARGPGMASSSAAKKMGALKQIYGAKKEDIGSRALGYMDTTRGNVEKNKMDLLSQMQGGAETENAANMASAKAAELTKPPQYDPLGDVFMALTANLNNAAQSERAGYRGYNGAASALFNQGNSSKIVG